MSGILRLESLTKGNTLRQGDLTLLKYRLFDSDGDKLDISGKSATVRLMKNDFTLIAYEKEGLTVASDDTISFNINKILQGGLYHLEVIVDDKYIFPSRADEGKFNVDKSSLGAELTIIENAGIDAVVRKAVELINEDPSLIIDEERLVNEIIANTGIGSIEEYYQQYSDVIKELSKNKDYHSLPEIAGARGGFDTLGERLNGEVFDMSRMGQDIKEAMTGGSVGVVGVNSVLTENIVDNQVTYEKTNFLKTGKNLLNMKNIESDFYVDYSNGNIVANLDNDITGFIQLRPNTTYTLSIQGDGDLGQLAFYDTNKTYVSGLPNTGLQTQVTFATEANVKYMRLTIPKTATGDMQLELGSVMTVFEPFKLLNDDLHVSKIDDHIVGDKHIDSDSNIVMKKLGKNLLNMSTNSVGYYVGYDSGKLIANADNQVTDYIELEPNTDYTLSVVSGDLGQLAFYDGNKSYDSGLPNTGKQDAVSFNTGDTIRYVRISIPLTIKSGMMLEKGTAKTEFEPYGLYIPTSDLHPSTHQVSKEIVTVKKDGSGHFTTVRGALEYASDSDVNNRFEVHIHEGVYDIFGEYSTSEITTTGFLGPIKTEYVDIIGIGDRDKIILDGVLPYESDVIPADNKYYISTLNLFGEGKLENLTVTSINMRYTIHDDWEYRNMLRHVKNCRFIKYRDVGSEHFAGKQAWGEGSWSGQEFIFEDCEFITEWDYPAYTSHNNVNFVEPSYHTFINCKFLSNLFDTSVKFQSLNSGQVDKVKMVGCRMSSAIGFDVISSNTSGKIDYKLVGYGNDVVPVKFDNSDDVDYVYEFSDQTTEYYNASSTDILKGEPVMFNGSGTSIVKFPMSGKIRFIGLALEDIPAGSSGVVQKSGYYPIKNTSLTDLIVGDKIEIVSGSLAKTTGSEYIGYVALNDYILLV